MLKLFHYAWTVTLLSALFWGLWASRKFSLRQLYRLILPPKIDLDCPDCGAKLRVTVHLKDED